MKLTRRGRDWLLIAATVLSLHYLVMALHLFLSDGSFSFSALAELISQRLMEPGDATRYIDIAQHGYVTGGENAINLVFYPLYPLLMRWLGWLTFSLPLSGVILSHAGYCAASILLYELILMDGDRRNAWDGVLLMALYPFSMFALGVFTEGIFLALSIGCLYALRKHSFMAAGFLGFLAALTRTAGEPWYQSTEWIGRNIALQYSLAHQYPGLSWIIYSVQIVLYFFILAVLGWGIYKKERMAYLLYGGVYLGFSFLSGWMISGGRYMLCCVPVYIILSKLKDGLPRRFLLLAAGLLFFLYSLLYLRGYAIM